MFFFFFIKNSILSNNFLFYTLLEICNFISSFQLLLILRKKWKLVKKEYLAKYFGIVKRISSVRWGEIHTCQFIEYHLWCQPPSFLKNLNIISYISSLVFLLHLQTNFHTDTLLQAASFADTAPKSFHLSIFTWTGIGHLLCPFNSPAKDTFYVLLW
jgi:hypothetical protein